MENDGKDVGMIQDFLFFLQNAVAMEHHCLESFGTTKNEQQYQVAEKVREIRSKWMYRIIKDSQDQIYCETKHGSGCAQGLKEMGNRYASIGNEDLAKECFNDSQIFEAIIVLINELTGGKK